MSECRFRLCTFHIWLCLIPHTHKHTSDALYLWESILNWAALSQHVHPPAPVQHNDSERLSLLLSKPKHSIFLQACILNWKTLYQESLRFLSQCAFLCLCLIFSVFPLLNCLIKTLKGAQRMHPAWEDRCRPELKKKHGGKHTFRSQSSSSTPH